MIILVKTTKIIVDKAESKMSAFLSGSIQCRKLNIGIFSIKVDYHYRLVSKDRDSWYLVDHRTYDKMASSGKWRDL